MAYELKLEKFSGPLEKLLELIESRELGLDDVSLAKVTDDFLKYLDEFRKTATTNDENAFRMDLRVLADFISVASRLILLKSKYLLPGLALTDDEEAEIKDLETRLERYRELRPAIRALGKLWRESHTSYSRPYFLGRGASFAGGQRVFYPGTNTDAASLAESLRKIFSTITTYEMETETIKEKIISLEEKIQDVLNRVLQGGDTNLAALSGEKTRAEMVLVFLAILHLAREQLVQIEQGESFSDIIVRSQPQK
jgi:segregation and condensation protein A